MDSMGGRCVVCQRACPGKRKWPEVVGMKAREAKEIIERENPYVEVVYIWCNWKRMMDCCCNRIFLFVEASPDGGGDYEEGKVCHVPIVG